MNDVYKIHKVKSQTNPNNVYTVTVYNDGFKTCDCVFFQMRGFRGRGCKHIKFIEEKYYKK